MKRSFAAMRTTRWLATAAAASILVGAVTPAYAQDANTNVRLNKVESEVRALQRKVFPGADGKFFEPQITAPSTPTPAPGAPSSTPVTDLLTRMDAVEAQMAQLTAQTEQNTNRLNQLEARLTAMAPPPAAVPGDVPAATGPVAGPGPAPVAGSFGAGTPAPRPVVAPSTSAPASAPRPVVAAPSNSRIEAVKAVVKPQTGDPADDEYSYGFRLWEAKFYPEAQQQLKLYLEKYPKHTRGSWGRNLLGRAYLDDGNPSEAAKWFLQNFQTDKRGERAPDSLLYLAISMKQLKDTKRACIALGEFSQTYAAEAAGRLNATYNATRNGLACS